MIGFLGSSAQAIAFWIAHIPKAAVPAFAWLVRFMLFPFAGKDWRIAERNIHRVFGLPPKTHFSEMFLQQCFRHTIICGIETIRGILRPSEITTEGFSKLKQLVAPLEKQDKGVLFVTSHLGSWEFCAYFAGRACERALHVLAKPPRLEWAKDPLEKFRRRMLVEVLWSDSKSLLKSMLGVLKRGESLGFVMDQKPHRRTGPIVNFFGTQTAFVSGPATLSIKHKIPVVGIHVVRTGNFRYLIEAEVLLHANHDFENEEVVTQLFASFIEKSIRTYPEQWTWNYRRWKDGGQQS